MDDTIESTCGFLLEDIVTVLQGCMGCSDKISHSWQSLLELLRVGNSKEYEFFSLLRQARPDYCVSSRYNTSHQWELSGKSSLFDLPGISLDVLLVWHLV